MTTYSQVGSICPNARERSPHPSALRTLGYHTKPTCQKPNFRSNPSFPLLDRPLSLSPAGLSPRSPCTATFTKTDLLPTLLQVFQASSLPLGPGPTPHTPPPHLRPGRTPSLSTGPGPICPPAPPPIQDPHFPPASVQDPRLLPAYLSKTPISPRPASELPHRASVQNRGEARSFPTVRSRAGAQVACGPRAAGRRGPGLSRPSPTAARTLEGAAGLLEPSVPSPLRN